MLMLVRGTDIPSRLLKRLLQRQLMRMRKLYQWLRYGLPALIEAYKVNKEFKRIKKADRISWEHSEERRRFIELMYDSRLTKHTHNGRPISNYSRQRN
jgi:hypothetical protein